MKALPKRKGNPAASTAHPPYRRLNESPPKKEGKFAHHQSCQCRSPCLNESPSKKEGKSALLRQMSVQILCLNESPSKKEGKSALAREGMLGESDPQ